MLELCGSSLAAHVKDNPRNQTFLRRQPHGRWQLHQELCRHCHLCSHQSQPWHVQKPVLSREAAMGAPDAIQLLPLALPRNFIELEF